MVKTETKKYTKHTRPVYDFYKGARLLAHDKTDKELAEMFNVQARTIRWYGSKEYHRSLERRSSVKNARVAYRTGTMISDDDDCLRLIQELDDEE